MKQTLSYVLITPYTVAKSRTGGVLARLLLRLDLELVGAQMIAPDEEFVQKYAELLKSQQDPSNPWAANLLSDYVLKNLAPSGGRRHRCLLLLFQGENPCKKLSDICGALYSENRSIESVTGETIRDTYADLIMDPEHPGQVSYFEPAVLSPRKQELADTNLALFAQWLPKQNTLVQNLVYPDPSKIEKTLVIIKPDNWEFASSRPGSIIDMFSKTGCRVIGMKIHRMSVAEALNFYQPLRDALHGKFSRIIGARAKEILEQDFHIPLSDATGTVLAETFGVEYGEDQFQQVIEFMSGCRPALCPPKDLNIPSSVKCMILIYEGEQAVEKIRNVLGPTDPLKAPGGTVRREFGSNIMVNTAHASHSVEQAEREMRIVRFEQNSCSDIITAYLISQGK